MNDTINLEQMNESVIAKVAQPEMEVKPSPEVDKQETAPIIELLDEAEIKSIAPELCDLGVQKFKEGKFNKEQVAFIANYIREDQKAQEAEQKMLFETIQKEFKKEDFVSIDNFFAKISDEKIKNSFDNLKTNIDFLTLMKSYINTYNVIIEPKSVGNDINSIKVIKEKIAAIRNDNDYYNDFHPRKVELQKEMDNLYTTLIKLEKGA